MNYINEFINEFSLSLLCITETWIHTNELPIIEAALPPTHGIINIPRSENQQGGGVGIVFSKSISDLKVLPAIHPFTTFEYLALSFKIKNTPIKLAVLYRPGRSGTDAEFITQFSQFLEHFFDGSSKSFIVGDFNYWVDSPEMNLYSANFTNLLDISNIRNHVAGSTHMAGHTLDLILSPGDEVNLIRNINVGPIEPHVSDHALITFDVDLPMPETAKRIIQFRNYKNIVPEVVMDAIASSLEKVDLSDNCESLVAHYNSIFSSLKLHLFPQVEKEILLNDSFPWFNGLVRALRKKRRAAERRWRRLRTVQSREEYVCARHAVVENVAKCKREYFKGKINSCNGDQRKLWTIMNGLLGKHSKTHFPEGIPEITLASHFNDFFINKIRSIRLEIDSAHQPNTFSDNFMNFVPVYGKDVLEHFHSISPDDAHSYMKKVKRTFCSKDPINFSKIFEFCDKVSPLVAAVINSSFEEGTFPFSEKLAVVHPLLKKSTLDPEVLGNYRPVSNLSYLSKIIERAILEQILPHLQKNCVIPEFQSAFRQLHSTETALCRIYNDLVLNVCEGSPSILVLLDLSAAFDTIDHYLLLEDLSSFGIVGRALALLRSYLTRRSQIVEFKISSSKPQVLQYGVPQGSILGPILFLVYACGLSNIISSHNVSFHLYADDTQIYLPIKNIPASKDKLSSLLSDIRIWMHERKLKLNEGKTEVIVIHGSSRNNPTDSFGTLNFGDSEVVLSDQVKNIGVVFDPALRFDKHINIIVRDCNFHLRNLSLIKRFLDKKSLSTLIHSLISSRVDYCNSLFLSLPKGQLKKLQQVLNRAARLILNVHPWHHITPSLIHLHWLPLKARIEFKICLTVFKILKFGQPVYLRCLLVPFNNQSEMCLRHSDDPYRFLEPRAVGRSSFVERSFSYAAPRLYNKLPLELKCVESVGEFKSKLKTYFFQLSYDVERQELSSDYRL